MADIAKTNLYNSLNLITNFSSKELEIISENETKIDVLEDKLSNYLVTLTDKDLSLQESKNVSKYLHSISDFERIGDHAENIMDISIFINENNVKLSSAAKTELDVAIGAVKDILNLAITIFANDDVNLAVEVEPLEEVVDVICGTLKSRHVERLKHNECTIEAGVAFNDLLANLERISDHCSNVALYVIDLTGDKKEKKNDGFESHQYTRKIRSGENPAFEKKYEEYEAKYLALL
jgi:phosphate:Na+ symporter